MTSSNRLYMTSTSSNEIVLDIYYVCIHLIAYLTAAFVPSTFSSSSSSGCCCWGRMRLFRLISALMNYDCAQRFNHEILRELMTNCTYNLRSTAERWNHCQARQLRSLMGYEWHGGSSSSCSSRGSSSSSSSRGSSSSMRAAAAAAAAAAGTGAASSGSSSSREGRCSIICNHSCRNVMRRCYGIEYI